MIAIVLAAAIATAAPAFAADVTLNGTLVCAQCELKKPDAHECQDVLLVKEADGKETEYHVVKNEVAKASGEACTLRIPATITGEVSEKDGRKWIAPTKIDKK